VRPVFVGRRHELSVLEDVWDAVCGGDRQVVFIGAEPGAGKSRLAGEVGAELERLGAAVLIGSCVSDLGPAYQPFEDPVEVLRSAVVDGLLVPAEPSTAAQVAARLGTLVGRTAPERDPHRDPADERREVYDALVGAVRAAAQEQPLVLLLEDLHWAGSTALQVLTYLIERTARSRLLILGTHRTTAPDRAGALIHQIAALHRLDGVRRLDLAPLETNDIADFLVREGRVPAYRARPAAVLLRERTGGNPFFLREVWRDLARRGGVSAVRTTDAADAPEVVLDMVHQRIATLPAAVHQVLAVAAVIGEEVDALTLLAVVGSADGLTAVDALIATGLLEPLPPPGGGYRFIHALARQAVLDRLPSMQRARHHEQIALLMEARGNRVERLAHHFAGAHALGYADQAVRYLTEAAQLADRSLAHAEAARLLERAATVCPGPYEREQHLLQAARSYYLACEFDRGAALLEQLAANGDARLRLAAATAYEEVTWLGGALGQKALDLLTGALRDVDPDTGDPAYIRALAGKARATSHTGAHEAAETLAATAIRLARAGGDAALLGDVLAASMQVGFRPAMNARKQERALELSDLVATHGWWIHLGPAAFHRAHIAYQNGDQALLTAARQDLDRMSESVGQRYWSYMGGCIDVAQALIHGRLAAAQGACQSVLELGESFSGDGAEGPYGIQSFMVRRESGALAAIRGLISGEEHADDHWAPALLALYTELGLTAAAGRLLTHVLGHDLDPTSARWPGVLGFAAEATLFLGDRDAAAQLRPLIEEYAGINLVMGPFVAAFGAADRYLAGLDALLDTGSPDDTFAAALALDERTGAVLHQAHTLAAWAQYARRSGRPDQAKTLEESARALAEPSGLVRVLAMLTPRRSVDLTTLRPSGLTDREDEVLQLLAEGLTNRALARRLRISENTAANHVRSILMKTGCTNRTEAAVLGQRLRTGH
jgi:DNA-binding CsgD family transcriptional regulator